MVVRQVSEPAPDLPPTLDLSSLTADDVPPPDDAPPPDHRASREPRRNPFTRDKREDAAPRRGTRARKSAPPRRRGVFVQPLEQMYGMVGTMLMLRDPVCGQAILESAPECARTLDELAYNNDAVRRVLQSLVSTNALGAVMIAHAPILLTVARHHVPQVRDLMGAPAVGDAAEQWLAQPNGAQEGGTDG